MDFSPLEAVATAVGAVLTGIGVVAAWRIARRAEQINESTRRVASVTTLQDWRRDIREWASCVIDEMAVLEDQILTRSDARVRSPRLSALLDRGRLFFPNPDKDQHGLDKPAAYRGWRHAILDPIEATIGVAAGERGLGRYRTRYEAMLDMRRHFVSRVQGVVDPESQNAEIARLIRETSTSTDSTMGGLLPSDDEIPSGADALLHGTLSIPRSRPTSLPSNER